MSLVVDPLDGMTVVAPRSAEIKPERYLLWRMSGECAIRRLHPRTRGCQERLPYRSMATTVRASVRLARWPA